MNKFIKTLILLSISIISLNLFANSFLIRNRLSNATFDMNISMPACLQINPTYVQVGPYSNANLNIEINDSYNCPKGQHNLSVFDIYGHTGQSGWTHYFEVYIAYPLTTKNWGDYTCTPITISDSNRFFCYYIPGSPPNHYKINVSPYSLDITIP